MFRRLACTAVVALGAAVGSGCSSSSSAADAGGAGETFGTTPASDLISMTPGSGGTTTWKVKWYMGTASENDDQGQQVTVHKGDSVIWVNSDNSSIGHTVTEISTPPVFNQTFTTESPPIAFPNAGGWTYFCSIHGQGVMSGRITVQ